jgi:hypothetical protein
MANTNTGVGELTENSRFTIEYLHTLDDANLGKVLRALGLVASDYREFKRDEIYAEPKTWTEDEFGRSESERKRAAVDSIDAQIGKFLFSVIESANIHPNSLVMHQKKAAFLDGTPILYWESWTTDDLDDPTRAPIEIQKLIGLNGSLETETGAAFAHLVVESQLDGAKIAPEDALSELDTLGTVPQDILEEFIDA